MGVRIYDEAIVQKINSWIKDPDMVVLKPNEVNRLFQIRADQKNDEPLKLPLIAVSRDSSITLPIPTRTEMSGNGKQLFYGQKQPAELNAIPIDISYQIDIYTRRYEEGDEYLRNFIFNFINHPKMMIEIEYNGIKKLHTCYAILDPNISDNSDISEHLFADEFTRWTLKITVMGAYLWSIPIKSYCLIKDVELVVADKFEDPDYEKEFEYVLPLKEDDN